MAIFEVLIVCGEQDNFGPACVCRKRSSWRNHGLLTGYVGGEERKESRHRAVLVALQRTLRRNNFYVRYLRPWYFHSDDKNRDALPFVKVRGYVKVKLHLMFGIIALFADQLLRLAL